jgi:diguanylate cyclase (GGDEF)-like protein
MSLALCATHDEACSLDGGTARPPRFRDDPIAAGVYPGLVVAVAAGIAVYELPRLPSDSSVVTGLLLVAAVVAAALRAPLTIGGWRASLSAGHAVALVSLAFVGPAAAMVVAAVAGAVHGLLSSGSACRWRRAPFAAAVAMLSVAAAGLVYAAAGSGTTAVETGLAGRALPLAAASLAQLLVNTLLVGGAVALTDRSVPPIPLDDAAWLGLSWVVGTSAVLGGVALRAGDSPATAAFLVAPLLVAHAAYGCARTRLARADRRADDTSRLHMATIEALALAIDAKDRIGAIHIRRLQVFAAGLARGMGMTPDDVQGVRTAAVLHDLGKLAVPAYILSKPGRLTPEEFQKVRIHPQIGADIIAGVPFPYPVAPIIRSHHERWDGNGYPAGLKGEEIPLGARVLSVVDSYEALTSDRPYHRARTRVEALQILQQEAGTAFDPRVVHTFVRLLPALEVEAVRQGEPDSRPAVAGARVAQDTTQPECADPVPCVFTDIALAHREIHKLYQLAQAMGTTLGVSDTMSVLASKLRELVPFSTCALFLPVEHESLRCVFAEGDAAEALRQTTFGNDRGVVGWVARNRRVVLGAAAQAGRQDAAGDTAPREAALVSPLVVSDRLVGVLALYDVQPGRYTEDHRRLMERVSEQAAPILANSILFEQTRRDSLTDPLTDLPNSRFMFVHLTRELARAERLRSAVSLIVMDVDDFKRINDGYGHQAGDRALREVARVLRTGIRPYDICVRYAGDEFVLVLSGCDAQEAEHKMRDLQRTLSDTTVEVRPGRFVKLGGSFGCASFPADGEAQERLFAIADERMYEDKARRKHRVPSAGASPAPPDADWLPSFANMTSQPPTTTAD